MSNHDDAIARAEAHLTHIVKSERKQRVHDRIVQDKAKKLIPVRKFLYRLSQRNLIVRNSDISGSEKNIPQPLSAYEDESSSSMLPGKSIYLDHPARIEIAIPNSTDVDKYGAYAVFCSSYHPDQSLLNQSFHSVDELLMALGEFLGRNATSVDGN